MLLKQCLWVRPWEKTRRAEGALLPALCSVCFYGLDHFYLLCFINCTLERMKNPMHVPVVSLI